MNIHASSTSEKFNKNAREFISIRSAHSGKCNVCLSEACVCESALRANKTGRCIAECVRTHSHGDKHEQQQQKKNESKAGRKKDYTDKDDDNDYNDVDDNKLTQIHTQRRQVWAKKHTPLRNWVLDYAKNGSAAKVG